MDGCFEPGLPGCRVRLVAEEGEYRGTVHSVNPRDSSVTLVGVTFECDGREEKLRGVQKFLHGDVRAISVLDCGPDTAAPLAKGANAPQSAPTPPAGRDGQVLDRGARGKPLVFQRLVDDTLLLSHVAVDDSDDSSSGEAGNARPRRPRAASPPALLPRPEGYAFVETAEELVDAVGFLQQQRTIGLAAEGVLIGRGGQLSLISLACEEFVFLVDIPSCGGADALGTLRPLLEDTRVGKVIHDSRGLSDLLWHQAETRLGNVFDTQAAEVYLYHRQFGKMPQYVSNVAHTLVSRLGLLPRQVFFPHYRQERMREDQAVWLRRPLPESLLESAVKNVVYLRELREKQLKTMMNTFVRCVDVFLESVRDSDAEDAAAAPHETHRVPVKVQKVLESTGRPTRAQPDDETPGVVHNVLPLFDKDMQFSRNVWRTERS